MSWFKPKMTAVFIIKKKKKRRSVHKLTEDRVLTDTGKLQPSTRQREASE